MRKIQILCSVALSSAAACFGLQACSSDSSTPATATDSGPTGNDANATDTSTPSDSPAGDTNVPDASDAGNEAAAGGGSVVWTLAPNPTCSSTTPAAVLCKDTGVTGGYQLVGGAACPLNNGLGIYLPGGSVPPAGTYTVKPASSTFDVVNLTAGQVAVSVTYHPNIMTQEEWFAQSGTVTVTNTGGKLGYSATLLPTKKYGLGTATTLTLTAKCN